MFCRFRIEFVEIHLACETGRTKKMHVKILQLFLLIKLSLSLAPSDLLILVLSQQDAFHQERAENLLSDLSNQSLIINREEPVVANILHEILNHPGYWTILPVLPDLVNGDLIKDGDTKWIILCEDSTHINLLKLINALSEEDYTKEQYIGYALHDREPTIVHHFSFFENPQWFPYPLIRSGVIFTVPFIRRLTKRVTKEKTTDFFIDASHELSLFIWNNMRHEKCEKRISNVNGMKGEQDWKEDRCDEEFLDKNENRKNSRKKFSSKAEIKTGSTENNNIKEVDQSNKPLKKGKRGASLMRAVPFVCLSKGHKCAIYPNDGSHFKGCNEEPIGVERIFFAIKTCQKFHKNRIPIVENTWGRYTVHKRYFSDVVDEGIPTISTGVPNAEAGHCEKTLSILKLALVEIENLNRKQQENKIQWIFLSDDDTILSISRVCDILSCFRFEKNLYLGERYGYRLHSPDGFNYITGGGGIIFSLSTVRKIINFCSCPSISSPDDMIIGACLQRLGIKPIHSSRFHQARPPDYAAELLSLEEPVSFHKFWQINPIQVYQKWFESADSVKLKNSHEWFSSIDSDHSSRNKKANCDINSSQCTKLLQKNGNTVSKKEESHLPEKVIRHHIEL